MVFLQLFINFHKQPFPKSSQCLSVHSSPLVIPTTQTLTVRRMVAGEPRAILMQITLSLFSVVLLVLFLHVHSLLLSLSPALSRISSFFFLRRTATVSHTVLPPARFRRDARACAPVFYYREPPAFFLSVFLFFHAATPRLTTLGRHVHDFRLPLVVAASFLPLSHIFLQFCFRSQLVRIVSKYSSKLFNSSQC